MLSVAEHSKAGWFIQDSGSQESIEDEERGNLKGEFEGGKLEVD